MIHIHWILGSQRSKEKMHHFQTNTRIEMPLELSTPKYSSNNRILEKQKFSLLSGPRNEGSSDSHDTNNTKSAFHVFRQTCTDGIGACYILIS